MSAFALPGPLSVQIEGKGYNGPALWLALTDLGEGLCVDDAGRPIYVLLSDINVDWRYDWRAQEWVTVNGVTDGEEGFDDDGGADVPGSVQYVDGDGDGDPLDTQGGPPTGDLGDVDADPSEVR
jgi:hypothetical protein